MLIDVPYLPNWTAFVCPPIASNSHIVENGRECSNLRLSADLVQTKRGSVNLQEEKYRCPCLYLILPLTSLNRLVLPDGTFNDAFNFHTEISGKYAVLFFYPLDLPLSVLRKSSLTLTGRKSSANAMLKLLAFRSIRSSPITPGEIPYRQRRYRACRDHPWWRMWEETSCTHMASAIPTTLLCALLS